MRHLLAIGLALLASPSIAAGQVSPSHVGVGFAGAPTDLAVASGSGVGLARAQIIEGSNTDAVVALTAAAHLRLYPMLGLPASNGAAQDAQQMAVFVTAFAKRYGPGGSFWTEHPGLPYEPTYRYEIGNEPDITPTDPFDSTHLHYANPADYALVYETARAALRSVNPSLTAVVGGMLDSGSVTLADAERYLSAIRTYDAVGYHPYLYALSSMKTDTNALRAWMNAHHASLVAIDVNEFDAPTGITNWGSQAASYTRWALCTSSLGVANVQGYWWGDVSFADSDVWWPMVSSEGVLTSYGQAYLSTVRSLVSKGC